MATSKPEEEFYTKQQVSNFAQVDLHTVGEWIASKQLRAVNLGTQPGKKIPRWRIRRDWWEAFLASRTTSPTPPAPKRKAKKQDAAVESFIK